MVRKVKIAVFWLAKYSGLFLWARRMTVDQPRILCYHGGALLDEWQYNGLLFMRAATFRERIEWLQKMRFDIVPLGSAVASGHNRSHPCVALTFDDGWLSTASELISILREKNLPSTLYLSTQQFLRGGPVFPVCLGYIFWKTRCKEVDVTGIVDGLTGLFSLREQTERTALITRIATLVSSGHFKNHDVEEMLEKLAERAGVSAAQLDLASRRFGYLYAHEVKGLLDDGCAVESHGHVHRYPKGEPDVFADDLAQCSAAIRALGLPSPTHYCYPSGNHDAVAADVLQRAGMVSATTCNPGLLRPAEVKKKYYLPRFLDGESIHMLEFQAEMCGFTEILRRLLGRVRIALR